MNNLSVRILVLGTLIAALPAVDGCRREEGGGTINAVGSTSLQPFAELLAQEYEKLRVAQLQHSLVLDALLAGEAARAEMLMREHAYIGLRYGRVLGLRTPV